MGVAKKISIYCAFLRRRRRRHPHPRPPPRRVKLPPPLILLGIVRFAQTRHFPPRQLCGGRGGRIERRQGRMAGTPPRWREGKSIGRGRPMKFLRGKFPSRPPLARTNDDGAHRVLRPKEDNDDDADDPADAMDIRGGGHRALVDRAIRRRGRRAPPPL